MNTPKFRVAFPNVFEARKNMQSGKMEYSVVALFPKDADLSSLKAAAEKACTEKWGSDKSKWPKGMRTPFRDQGERIAAAKENDKSPPDGYVDGAIYLNLKSKNKPHVVDENVEDIIEPSEFYAGCWARASVSCYAYDNMGNKGVNFGLNNLQKLGDAEPFGNKTRPQDDFSPVTSGTKTETSSDSVNDIFG